MRSLTLRRVLVQILICQNLRNNLMHPNEYIRGVTLRFLCRIKEEEILEPLTPSILQNLEHRCGLCFAQHVLPQHRPRQHNHGRTEILQTCCPSRHDVQLGQVFER